MGKWKIKQVTQEFFMFQREFPGKNHIEFVASPSLFLIAISLWFLQDNVLLGTDYPFPLGDLTAGEAIENSTKLDQSTKVQ